MQFHTSLFQQHASVVVIIQALYLIRQSFSTALPSNLKNNYSYLALVHSHLCYYSQVWRPRLIEDIATLERDQCGATKYNITRLHL